MAIHNDVGKRGEQLAVDYLEEHGYIIQHRNWKAPKSRHELDIVAVGDNRLVVAEVKTRSGIKYGDPTDAVDARKVNALTAAANSYVQQYKIDLPIRFDILSVVGSTVEHIKGAFLPPLRCY
ncbi:MAG: YraN family protein [Bacteroidaceae bacterium]|nr:YraN family protein [Bacteroidaceae bacterium]